MKKGVTFMLVLMIVLTAFIISGCMEKQGKITVAITFDTEYPYGILNEELNYTNEQKWLGSMNRIKSVAEENSLKFQFNVLGKTAEDYPNTIRELGKSQSISCHTYSHKNQKETDYAEKEQEIGKCREILENITGNAITGNRFPYTKHDNDSFGILEKKGYKWDSSVWADSKDGMVPYDYGNLTEFPLFFAIDDWEYFMNENRTDAKEFYGMLYEDIKISKDREITYIVLLHPWVLSIDEKRVDEFEEFVEKLRAERIEIKSLDEIYKSLQMQKIQPKVS